MFTFDGGLQGLGGWLWSLDSYQVIEKVRLCPRVYDFDPNYVVTHNEMGYQGCVGGSVESPYLYVGADAQSNPTATSEVTHTFAGGYGLNGYFYADQVDNNNNPTTNNFKTEASVYHPSQTPVFGDCMWNDAVYPTPTDQAPGGAVTTRASTVRDYWTGSQWDKFDGIARFCLARHGSMPGKAAVSISGRWAPARPAPSTCPFLTPTSKLSRLQTFGISPGQAIGFPLPTSSRYGENGSARGGGPARTRHEIIDCHSGVAWMGCP